MLHLAEYKLVFLQVNSEKRQFRLGKTLNIQHKVSINFACINICQVSREMVKTEDKRQGFEKFPRDLTNVNAMEHSM